MASTLLDYLRSHLISQGVVRKPAAAGSVPPLWLSPRAGVPAPGEGANPTEVGQTIVLGAFRATGIPPAPYESFKRYSGVDIYFRTATGELIDSIEAQIRAAVIDKRNWNMAGLTVIESLLVRELQFLHSDQQGFAFNCQYMFELYQ